MSQKPDDRLWFVEEWIGYLYLDFVEYCDGARPSVSRSRFSVQLPGWFTARRLRFRFVPAPRHPAPPRPPEPRLPLGNARRGSRKVWYRARSMAARTRKGLLRAVNPAGRECRRRRMRRGRSVTAARARCASACPAHARPSPNRNTIGVQASLARPRVSQGHSAQSSPPPKTELTREQRERAERNRLWALANLHAMMETSPMQASVSVRSALVWRGGPRQFVCVPGLSGAPGSLAQLHRFGRVQPGSLTPNPLRTQEECQAEGAALEP